MNRSHVLLDDWVSLSCSVTYRSQVKLRVTMTLTEASRTVKVISTSPAGGGHCTLSASVRARKRQFGPFRCTAVFTRADNWSSSGELARNSVQLRSNVIQVIQPACTWWPSSLILQHIDYGIENIQHTCFMFQWITLSFTKIKV